MSAAVPRLTPKTGSPSSLRAACTRSRCRAAPPHQRQGAGPVSTHTHAWLFCMSCQNASGRKQRLTGPSLTHVPLESMRAWAKASGRCGARANPCRPCDCSFQSLHTRAPGHGTSGPQRRHQRAPRLPTCPQGSPRRRLRRLRDGAQPLHHWALCGRAHFRISQDKGPRSARRRAARGERHHARRAPQPPHHRAPRRHAHLRCPQGMGPRSAWWRAACRKGPPARRAPPRARLRPRRTQGGRRPPARSPFSPCCAPHRRRLRSAPCWPARHRAAAQRRPPRRQPRPRQQMRRPAPRQAGRRRRLRRLPAAPRRRRGRRAHAIRPAARPRAGCGTAAAAPHSADDARAGQGAPARAARRA